MLLLSGLPALAVAQGQPRVVEARPAPGAVLEAHSVLALKLAGDVPARPRALCDVAGVRSAVPTQVLSGAERQAALRAAGVGEADEPARWLLLRCQTRLPDGAAVSLRWLDAQPSPTPLPFDAPGVDTWQGQRLDYTARSAWPAAVLCNRGHAAAGCNPLEPVRLRLTAPVLAADLAQLRLRAADGRWVLPAALEGEAADELVFKGLLPRQTYRVVWPTTLRTPSGAPWALKPPTASQPLTVRMGPYPPLAKFGADFGIAERAAGAVVPLTVRGVEGAPQASRVWLRSLHVADEPGIVQALQALSRLQRSDDSAMPAMDTEEPAVEGPPALQKLGSARFPFQAPPRTGAASTAPLDTRAVSWLKSLPGHRTQALPRRLETAAFEVLGVPLQRPGLHLLEVESRLLGRGLLADGQPMHVRAGALVTDLAVHLHWSDRLAAVWVTRLSTGQPVAGAHIGLFDCQGKPLAQGRAQAEGWAHIELAQPVDNWQCPLYVFARQGDDLGLASSRWQRGIESWRFEHLGERLWADTTPRRVHAVLARNLLRPGETLHAQLYWRQVNLQGALQMPAAAAAARLPGQATLVHTGSGERRNLPLVWDARGQAELVAPMSEGSKRGLWRIDLGVELSGGDFRVEDFRLPVLKAEVLAPPAPVQLEAPSAAQAPQVVVGLRLNYLSGGPAAGETVQVVQRLLPHVPRFEAFPGWWFGSQAPRWDGPPDADAAAALATQADDQPVAPDQALRLGADGTRNVTAVLQQPLSAPRTLLTEMSYRDPDGETYRAQGRTVLWPAALVLGSKPQSWASGQSRTAEFVVLDVHGRPQADVAVQVQGGFQGWVVHRRRTVGGLYSYHSERREEPPQPLCEGLSGADGRFVCSFQAAMATLDSGEFTVQARAVDAQGRSVTTGQSLWLYNGDEVWFGQGDHDRMDVLSAQPRYQPGEVATLQVRSPFREATAWVSVLRGGAVVDTLVLPISGREPSIRLPIKASYAPNVFVNVLAVRGRVAEPAPTALVDLARPAYKLGIAHLEVGGQAQALQVRVATDRPVYQTRETARVSLQVLGAGAADGPGATAGPLPAGRSALVFAIDEALLELLPNDSWDLLKAMLQQHGYGFETASAAMQVIGKRHFGRKALPPGGGGGRSAARELFDTLLLWRAKVPLDAQGRAQLDVPLNDSLTRFRVVAVADAGADRFGSGHASFTVTRDLQLLSGLPATVREGDRYQAVFTVRNASAQPLQASVQAQVGDLQLPPQRVDLPPQSAQRLSWPVTVPTQVSSQRWRLQARASGPAGERQDALDLQQAVSSALNPLRFTVAAPTALHLPSQRWPVQPPEGAVPGRGELVVALSPRLAADASGVRDYMRSYPFYCLEQRTSKAVSLKDPVLWQRITDGLDTYITATGLVDYYPQQVGSGQGYEVLTAFVLSAAHEAGWTLPEAARQRMLQGLEQFVQGRLQLRHGYGDESALGLTERKLLALEALARYGQPAPTLADSLRTDATADLPRWSHRALVQWLDVLQRVRWPQRTAWMAEAQAELDRRLVADGRGGLRLVPRPAEQRWYWMQSEDSSQARLALLALDLPALADRADRLALGAVHLQRGGAHWWSTQANVWGSLMLDRRAAQRSVGPTGSTRVGLGAQVWLHDWAQQPQGQTLRLPLAGAGVLQVEHSGGGRPVVSAHGQALAPLRVPLHQGLQVQRTVKPLKQQTPGQWTAGDTVEVQLRFQVPVGTGWLVLSDALPPGATVLGSGLRGQDAETTPTDGRRGWRHADGSWTVQPAYVERSFSHLRAYYEHLWAGDVRLNYQLRLNTSGLFQLPPTQLEAMYDPDLLSHLPQAPWEVK